MAERDENSLTNPTVGSLRFTRPTGQEPSVPKQSRQRPHKSRDTSPAASTLFPLTASTKKIVQHRADVDHGVEFGLGFVIDEGGISALDVPVEFEY